MDTNVSKQQKQVLLLYVSSVIGLFIGVLNSVLNTRSLEPVLYGDVRYVQNIISFVSSLLLFGYFVSGSRLLAISKDELYSRRIRGVLCVILGVTILVVMLTMTCLYFISCAQGKDNLSLLYLIAVPCCGNVLMLNYINTTSQGDNHIGRISIARLLPSTIYFCIAYFVFKYFGATPGRMLAIFNGTAVLVLLLVIASTKPSFVDLRSSFKLLREENRTYGFNVYLGSLVAVSTGYLSGITLGQFCEDNTDVGFYTLAMTLATPLSMLPSIIGTTYYKQFATQFKISKKVLLGSIGLTGISCLLFFIFIKYIVLFLYTESYSPVSVYASWLAIGFSLHGLGDMFNRFLGSHGLGKELRNGAIASGFIKIAGSIVLVYFFKIEGAVVTMIISSVAYLLMMVLYYSKFVKTNGEVIG